MTAPTLHGQRVPQLDIAPTIPFTRSRIENEVTALGLQLDAWQIDTAAFASNRVNGVVTPRQNGKTHLGLVESIRRAVLSGESTVYSACSVDMARNNLRRAAELLDHAHPNVQNWISQVRRGHGQESIEFRSPLAGAMGPGPRILFVVRGASRPFLAERLIVDDAQRCTTKQLGNMIVSTQPESVLLMGSSPFPDRQSMEAASGFVRTRQRAVEGSPETSWREWGIQDAYDKRGKAANRSDRSRAGAGRQPGARRAVRRPPDCQRASRDASGHLPHGAARRCRVGEAWSPRVCLIGSMS